MARESKTRIRFFTVWTEKKEMEWLDRMARDGWALTQVVPFVYSFQRSAAGSYIHRADFRIGKFDEEEYLSLFRDAGWEYLCRVGGWYYFRIDANVHPITEIYTDNSSKAQKYRRLLWFLLIVLFHAAYFTLLDLGTHLFDKYSGAYGLRWFMYAVVAVGWYAIISIARMFLRLKRNDNSGED